MRRQRMSAVDNGVYVADNRETLREYMQRWLKSRKSEVAAYTHTRYTMLAEKQLFPHIGSIPVSKLTPARLAALYADLTEKGGSDGGPLSTTTVGHVHRVLHACLQSGVLAGSLALNVADRVKSPRTRKVEVDALEIGAFKDLIKAIKANSRFQRFLIPTLLGGCCGLRRGEMLALRWEDINRDAAVLTVSRSLESIRIAGAKAGGKKTALSFKTPKSGRSRNVAIPASVAEELERHRLAQEQLKDKLGSRYQEQDLVVCQIDGTPWPPESFSPRFVSAAKTLGFPGLHFHALRHTAVSVLLSLGANVKAVQEMAGHHSSAFTLDRYGHVTPTIQQEGAARFDAVLRRGVVDGKTATNSDHGGKMGAKPLDDGVPSDERGGKSPSNLVDSVIVAR
jgi:integrase